MVESADFAQKKTSSIKITWKFIAPKCAKQKWYRKSRGQRGKKSKALLTYLVDFVSDIFQIINTIYWLFSVIVNYLFID